MRYLLSGAAPFLGTFMACHETNCRNCTNCRKGLITTFCTFLQFLRGLSGVGSEWRFILTRSGSGAAFTQTADLLRGKIIIPTLPAARA
jgi:hypothetical protein